MVQLNELIGQKEPVKIIEFLISNPSQKISQTQIRLKLKISKATAIKWMGKIVKLKLVKLRKIGQTYEYELSNENPLIKELKRLKTIAGLAELKKIGTEVYLYGSAARGENREDSDIDLLIIGKTSRTEIIKDIDSLSNKIKKTVSFKIFSPVEWSAVAKNDPAFYERVEKDKVQIQ
jgi:predicted nucleotidyltransferase